MSFVMIRKTIDRWSSSLVPECLRGLVGSELNLRRVALNSGRRQTLRTAFVAGMVLELLLLQSAAVLLHHECGGSHSILRHAVTATLNHTSLVAALHDIWHRCSHPSCQYSHAPALDRVAESQNSSTPHPLPLPARPHHADNCQICQALSVARITATAVRCPEVTGYAPALPDRYVPVVAVPRPYRLPSRGPPA